MAASVRMDCRGCGPASMATLHQMSPDAPHRRRFRRPRFRLRMLLVAIALFAVLAGLYGRRAVVMSREFVAVQQVLRLGGRVTYGGEQSLQTEAALTRLVGYLAFDDFDHVIGVRFEGIPVGDEEVAVLRHFRRVQAVTLWKTPVTDECIDTLINLPHLRSVSINHTEITNAGLRRLETECPTLMVYGGG